ncbi:MAG: PQQ-dependent sugar dehydrogenase [Verrucomicrobiota bacterium]
MVTRRLWYLALSPLALASLFGSESFNDIPQGRELYTQWCVGCHGAKHEGGLGGSLVNDPFKQVGRTIGFLEYVKEGNLEVGMPSFEAMLTDNQILSIAHYIAHIRKNGIDAPLEPKILAQQHIEEGKGSHDFAVEEVFKLSGTPWGIDFFPGKSGGLITHREGDLSRFENDRVVGTIRNVPPVRTGGQAGMMEVAFHPEYDTNGWIYLAYSHESEAAGMTRVVRGRIEDDRWVDQEVIFQAQQEHYLTSKQHWGTRIVFTDGYLFFGIGDRGRMNDAQDLSKPNGKIHRVYDDGRIPKDNPFSGDRKALPSIWAYGVRNPQGLDLHPLTGELWESEHGPRGGDEINVIERGKNYGWPEITYGINYNGTPISDRQRAPGMEQPRHYWTPSIAVCGMDFYEGSSFPNWKYNLFAGGLRSNELHRLVIEDGEVVESEIILKDEGRIRDVASGPDGALYLVMNGPSRLVRLVP